MFQAHFRAFEFSRNSGQIGMKALRQQFKVKVPSRVRKGILPKKQYLNSKSLVQYTQILKLEQSRSSDHKRECVRQMEVAPNENQMMRECFVQDLYQ